MPDIINVFYFLCEREVVFKYSHYTTINDCDGFLLTNLYEYFNVLRKTAKNVCNDEILLITRYLTCIF